jgi:hypothetical protein
MATKDEIATSFLKMVPLASILPINVNLTPANETTMNSLLGPPQMPLTTSCQQSRASALVKSLQTTAQVAPLFKLTGIKPAVESVGKVLAEAFQAFPDLAQVLSTEGMLCVRLRKPTSGQPSTKISNHAWGTGVDFKIDGHAAPGNTHDMVPKFIAILVPIFNRAGWVSGIAFHDSMHFEVAEETIKQWSKDGQLGT